MVFDLEEGLYIFEITLGYHVGESEYMTVPFILRADDADEAEEMVQEYLEIHHLANSFWIVEISDTFDPVGINWRIIVQRIFWKSCTLMTCNYRKVRHCKKKDALNI
jgi:hypothetical protein